MPIESRAEALESRQLFAASTFGGSYFDNVQRVVTAADGSYVVAGLFSGTTTFPNSTRLTAQGDSDIYVAKFAANDSLLWVRQIGGPATEREMGRYDRRDLLINPRRAGGFATRVGDQPREAGEYVNDVTLDADGNVLLAGAFRKTISIGSMTMTADNTIDDNYYDALVVKYSPEGDLVWARHVGGPFDDVAHSIAVDASGTPYIAGYYTRTADFDPSSKRYVLNTIGRDAGYVMRMTSNGALAWVYQFQSESVRQVERNAVTDIAVTGRGEVYLVGTFGEKADFDASAGKYVLSSEGESDAFLANLDRKGRLKWALSTGGNHADGNAAVALGSDGEVYTAGYFIDEVDVDPRPGAVNIFKATGKDGRTSRDYSDILISRFTATGEPVWQAQMGGEKWETIGDLTVAADGSIYTVGAFYKSADFAPGKSVRTLTSLLSNDGSISDRNEKSKRDETYDWYVSRLSPRGKYISAQRFGGQDDDFLSAVAIRPDNTLLLGGRAVTARGERKERNEQALILRVTSDLIVI